jgi:hypothetical protein
MEEETKKRESQITIGMQGTNGSEAAVFDCPAD